MRKTVYLLTLALLTTLAEPTLAQSFVGEWDVSLGATAAINHDYHQVDPNTRQRVTTTTLGPGASDEGTLRITSDGNYRLEFWEYGVTYNAPVIEGRWQPVAANDPFADRGAIELLLAKPTPQAAAADRKWYVFRNAEGSVEARYPPYDGYAKILLKPRDAAAAKSARAKPSATAPAATRPATGPQTGVVAPSTSTATPATRTYTPDQVRATLRDKTLAEVKELLGEPSKEAYGTYYWNGVEQKFPPAPGGNWKSFAIQFGGPNQSLSSLELQYWVVE